jgi:hypothetical protein
MIDLRVFEPEPQPVTVERYTICECPHCDCTDDCCGDEDEIKPRQHDWFLLGKDWITDRFVLLRRDVVDASGVGSVGESPVSPDTILKLLAEEPATHESSAHFLSRYLDPLEAAGLRVVPSVMTNTDSDASFNHSNRAHLVRRDDETVGVLMAHSFPTDGTRTAVR